VGARGYINVWQPISLGRLHHTSWSLQWEIDGSLESEYPSILLGKTGKTGDRVAIWQAEHLYVCGGGDGLSIVIAVRIMDRRIVVCDQP
jgi:hypothetical protein